MEIDKRLQEIFDELHDKAYPFQEFHAYEFKQANQVIRKHFEKLLSEQTTVREDTNHGVEFDKIDYTYWLYEELMMKKPSSEQVDSLIEEYLKLDEDGR